MISINLLPDIKQQYLGSQKVKRLFIVGSILVSMAFVTIAVLVGLWVGAQKLHLDGLQRDIDEVSDQLKQESDLNKIVTIQKQLERLPELHKSKVALQRLFDYVPKLIPAQVNLNTLQIDTGELLGMEIRGRTTDAKMVNVLADTLKNAKFTHGPDGQKTEVKPFSDVRVTTYGIESNAAQAEGTFFTITMVFDRTIFDNTLEKFELMVPKITSSPSVTERPGNLFEAIPNVRPREGAQP